MARSKSSLKKPKPSRNSVSPQLVLGIRCVLGGLFVLILLISWMIGGSNQGEIYTYTQPKDSNQDPAKPARMLGAIIPKNGEAWFFKLTGPDKETAGVADGFASLVKSIKFGDDERPKWTLPDSWRQLPDDAPQNRGMVPRFATLQIPTDKKPLEISVTRLPFASDPRDREKDLLQNINRWRNQLQLSELDTSQLDDETTTVAVDDVDATLVNFVGMSGGSGGMTPPFAGGGQFAMPPRGAAPSSSAEPSFEVPEGWEESTGSSISRFAYHVSDDTGKVAITVTPIGKQSDLLPNVLRWRSQIGLGEISQDELNSEVKKLSLGGVTGDYVEMIGAKETILAVLAVNENQAWFIKLRGDRELASREKSHFEQFVESFRFQ